MKTFKTIWEYSWSAIALPFCYCALFCAVIGAGPKAAKEWAIAMGMHGFRTRN